MKKFNRDSKFYLQRSPVGLCKRNRVTWNSVLLALQGADGLTIQELAVASRDHEEATWNKNAPRRFVMYCIDSGWLGLTPTKSLYATIQDLNDEIYELKNVNEKWAQMLNRLAGDLNRQRAGSNT